MIGLVTLALLGQMNVRAKIAGPVDAYGNVLVRCVNCSSGTATGDGGTTAGPPASTVAVSNFPASQAVTGTFWPQTQPVSGTFWQPTQPVSGPLTDTQLRASAVPVSGTFWPNTQPVSGSVSVSNLPATQPVSGSVSVSNFPATQPVSGTLACTGPVTDTQLRASALPVSLASVPTHAVTGTFWQTTQPVSIASMPSTPVTGTFWQATQPVSGSVSVSNFPATQPVSLAVAPTTPVTGTFWQATQPVSGTVTANAGTGTMAVSGPLTDTQLRTTPVPVSLSSTTITGTVATSDTQAGTWTVQPGNTPNTTAWLVRGDYTTGKTNTMKTGTLASSATTADQVVLTYTVTTGKTFYLQYMAVNGRLTTFAATATLFGECSLESPAGTKLVTTMLAGPGLGDRDYLPFTEPVPIAGGVVIRIVCTPAAVTAFTWRGNLGGYER